MKKVFSIFFMAFVAMTVGAYNLTVGTCEHGTISFKVDGNVVTTSPAGKNVTILVTPEEGYVVISVKAIAYSEWDAAKAPRRSPSIVKDVMVTGSGNEWNFTMPEANVEVNAIITGQVTIDGVTAEVTDPGNKEMTVVSVETTDGNVSIPSEVNIGGMTYQVTAISADAFSGQDVTDVYIPETENPLTIPVGTVSASVSVHTSLSMLDDYALMTSLRENYESKKITAKATAPERFWTFSSGVDVKVPDGVTVYRAFVEDGIIRILPIDEANQTKIIKANNGVLLSCDKMAGGDAYEFVANPSGPQSGATVATTDANSYANNAMEPVIESKNYAAGQYLIMKGNEFHTIANNGSKVPACKAVFSKAKAGME